MRDITPFPFTPDYQPEGRSVSFELKPLDLQTQYKLQASMVGNGLPTWEAAAEVFERFVVGWQGLEVEYSPKAKREVLAGAASAEWMIWIGNIAGCLYRRSMLTDAERKN